MHLEVHQRTVVSLCDESGIVLRPWAEAGYRCICIDTAHPRGVTPAGLVAHVEPVSSCAAVSARPSVAASGTVLRVGLDVRLLRSFIGVPFGVFAWPPCTHLANIGSAAWSRKGDAALLEALSIADACLRIARRASWWAVENPVGRLSHHWGPPDHVFDPCDYGGYLTPSGDAYTKRTCLWTGGSFRMPPPRPVDPVEGSLVARVPDARRRSETPRGFARAVFDTMCPDPSPPRDPLRAADPSPPGYLFPSSHPLPSGVPFLPPESCRPGEPLQPADRLLCPACGTEFVRGRRDQRFCSTRCRVHCHRSRRRLV